MHVNPPSWASGCSRISRIGRRLAAFVLLLASATGARASDAVLAWSELPSLPGPLGVGGPFVGAHGGALLVAGGANFPDAPPWKGGTKAYSDALHVLPRGAAAWVPGLRLERPLAYGAAVSLSEGVVLLGGMDARQVYADVVLLRWDGGARQVRQERLPPLPAPSAYLAAAAAGPVIFVAAGQRAPDETEHAKAFWMLDLSRPEGLRSWEAREPWPGEARIKAVAAVQADGAGRPGFYLVSGEAAGPRYLRDGYRYDPAPVAGASAWTRIADVPRPVAAGCAVAAGPSHLFVFSGSTGEGVERPVEERPGFPARVLAYHAITDTWIEAGDMPRGVVTTGAAPWGDGWAIPSGEIRPGVRTPAVMAAAPTRRPSSFGLANLATLSLYPVVMLAIGLHYAGRKKGTNDFFRGGQRVPWWAAGLSLFATMLSSITFMAVPAKAYATDWTYYLGYVTAAGLAPVVIAVYLPFFRRLDVTSAYEYLEKRFNPAVRLFASASFILFQVGRTAIVLFLPALALSTVSTLDIHLSILLMGALSIAMTFFGGMEAVIWTDVAQTVILLAAALLSVIAIAGAVPGGAAGVVETARADGKLFGGTVWAFDLTVAGAWVVLIGNTFTSFVSYTSNQEVVQRYLTTRDERQAARSIWVNAGMTLVAGVLFLGVGTALYAFYHHRPERLDPALSTDAIFPLYMVRELPAGLAGLVVAGIFAAAQPTSSLNSVATAVTTDFYRRFAPQAPDASCMRLARWTTVVAGLLGTAVSLLMARQRVLSLWDTFNMVLGLTGGLVCGLFSLGLLTRRAHGRGAILGAVAGAGVLFYVTTWTRIHVLMYGCVGVVSCFVLGYVLSRVIPAPPRDLAGLTLYTKNGAP